eukprot:TRINITY_DN26570_c0_g1_i1.p1 TRINITY_DN26570_c0_g1~~TRINITY_DN26570_c0_g1_i1.p1  ORF type:complete len:133 (-),score=26.89 TRINITY_DN26570_c0_g1_i1:199-597(-)
MSTIASSFLLPAAKPVARFNGRKAYPAQRKNVVSFRSSTRTRGLQISCAKADADTLEKVKDVICKQLAMEGKDVLPDSKFADLGADSLDTVEIMMVLEEKFEISLNQDGSDKIVTVQDAADLIHEVCLAKPK